MTFDAKKIELFKNLAQFDLNNVSYDLHNDFNCVGIKLNNNNLKFLFKKNKTEDMVSLNFQNADLTVFEFSDFSNVDNLTIDNLYRGRFEESQDLIEFSTREKSYFYVDFCEDLKIEFWSDFLIIESEV